MHSLCLFIIETGALGSQVQLRLDFKDDPAANRELRLAARVLEIVSSDVIQHILFLKNKIKTLDSFETGQGEASQHRGTWMCSYMLLFFQMHYQEPKRGPTFGVPLWRFLRTTLNPGKGNEAIIHYLFFC